MSIFQQYPTPNTNSLGDGFDFQGYTFSSPLPAKMDTYVAKLDYNLTANGTHQLFVRGGLVNDHGASAADPTSLTGTGGSEFPGQPANATHLNNSKGLIVGYTGVFRPNLLNSFRYGFIRQGFVDSGTQSQHYINFRGFDNLTAETPTSSTKVPVHNFVDDRNLDQGVSHHSVRWQLAYHQQYSRFQQHLILYRADRLVLAGGLVHFRMRGFPAVLIRQDLAFRLWMRASAQL